MKWKIGSASITLPPNPTPTELPLYHHPLLHTSDTARQALPEIQHQFREPEARPPQAISQAFTIAVLLPWIVLIIGIAKIGFNFALFPSGSGSIIAICFHASILVILGIVAQFWLKVDMFTTLQNLSIVSVPAIFFGHKTLREIAAKRLGLSTIHEKTE